VNYLLDTHAAIWLLEGSQELGARAREALAAEKRDSVAISGISLLEISMLATRGTITLAPTIEVALAQFAEKLSVLPINARIAALAPSVLPHGDPFDRVITATAKAHELTLITKDREIARAGVVPILW
jgi:PIN domain nuclease of toxin-antitoxin system